VRPGNLHINIVAKDWDPKVEKSKKEDSVDPQSMRELTISNVAVSDRSLDAPVLVPR
jgi:hypothetical protein